MSCNTQRFKLDARSLLLGKDTKQSFCITTKGDVSNSLDGKYWVFHAANTNAKYVVWYNTSGGAAIAPVVPGSTLVEVAVTTGGSAASVATATATALAALTSVIDSAVASGNEIEVVLELAGPAFVARDALASASKTGFSILLKKAGYVQVNLGALSGDVTLTIEQDLLDITDSRFGSFVIAQVRRGATASAEFSLKDVSSGQLQRLLKFNGSVYQTDDADQKVIGGLGSANIFTSTEDAATQLIFRPTGKVANADPSEDVTMPIAYLNLGELTFSSENEAVFPVTATAYLSEGLDPKANFLVFGDAAKVLSV